MSRRQPTEDLRATIEELEDKLEKRTEELNTARARALKLEEQLKDLKGKPAVDTEMAKKLKAATDENVTLKGQIRDKDELLRKAKAALDKSAEEAAKAKADAKLADELAAKLAKAENDLKEANKKLAEAEDKAAAKAQHTLSASPMDKNGIVSEMLLPEERECLIRKVDEMLKTKKYLDETAETTVGRRDVLGRILG